MCLNDAVLIAVHVIGDVVACISAGPLLRSFAVVVVRTLLLLQSVSVLDLSQCSLRWCMSNIYYLGHSKLKRTLTGLIISIFRLQAMCDTCMARYAVQPVDLQTDAKIPQHTIEAAIRLT